MAGAAEVEHTQLFEMSGSITFVQSGGCTQTVPDVTAQAVVENGALTFAETDGSVLLSYAEGEGFLDSAAASGPCAIAGIAGPFPFSSISWSCAANGPLPGLVQPSSLTFALVIPEGTYTFTSDSGSCANEGAVSLAHTGPDMPVMGIVPSSTQALCVGTVILTLATSQTVIAPGYHLGSEACGAPPATPPCDPYQGVPGVIGCASNPLLPGVPVNGAVTTSVGCIQVNQLSVDVNGDGFSDATSPVFVVSTTPC